MAKRMPSRLNLLIAIDKPAGITSHDVVARVRRSLDERRVGHAGTLDPMATGVVVVGVGQATRILGLLALDTKAYVAEISFGAETNTDDAEGSVVRTAPCPPELTDPAFAAAALAGTVGRQEQVPPAFSAISVDGVRSYRRARAGEDVELPARPIEVRDALLLGISEAEGAPRWTVAYTVSKGTYIRALARDLGRAVGSAAHLSRLRRTASGSIGLGACLALDGLDERSAVAGALDPVAALGVPSFEVARERCDDVLNGRRIPASAVVPRVAPLKEGEAVALVRSGSLIALYRHDEGMLVPETVFPQPIGGVRL